MPNHGFQNRTIRLEGKDQKIPKNINVDLEFDDIKIFHVRRLFLNVKVKLSFYVNAHDFYDKILFIKRF